MRKREFLKKLRVGLKTEGYNEIDDVIDYYDELIEDRIDRTGETEEEVIYSLGSINDIVLRVTGGSSSRNDDRIRYDEYDEYESNTKEYVRKKEKKMSKNDSFALGVVIAVLTFPIWFGAVLGLGAAIFGITVGGIAICVAGFACIAYGIPLFSTSIGNGAFTIGIGIILIALSTIIIPLITKLIKLIIKAIIYVVKWLLGKAHDLKERRK